MPDYIEPPLVNPIYPGVQPIPTPPPPPPPLPTPPSAPLPAGVIPQPQVPIGVSQPVRPQASPPLNPMTQGVMAPQGVPSPAPRPAPRPNTIKTPPLVWDNTQNLLALAEKKLGGKVVSYYMSGGWSMVQDDVKYFYSHLEKIGRQEKLYFILISSGGDGMSAWRIASLLRDFCDRLIIVLPERAASAATMLSLSADELVMGPLSYLTAVDTSLMHPLNPKDPKNNPIRVELEEVKRSIEVLSKNQKEGADQSEIYKTLFNYIHPVALGAIERSKNLSEMLCSDILDLRKTNILDQTTKTNIINHLNSAYPAHGYPIPRHKAKELGLNVTYSDFELDSVLWNLINTYRYLTEEARTDMDPNSIHIEQNGKVIESIGSRLYVRNVIDRRLDPIIKGWSTFKDEYKWMNLFEKEENGVKKLVASSLEF